MMQNNDSVIKPLHLQGATGSCFILSTASINRKRIADSYLNMITQHNNRLDEFISKYGNGSEKFTIELYRLIDDKKELIERELEIEKMGYNLFDVCKAQNAELLQKINLKEV